MLAECYGRIRGVRIRNPTTDAWAGSIIYLHDNGTAVSEGVCATCSQGTSTARIVALGSGSTDGGAGAHCASGRLCDVEASRPGAACSVQAGKDIAAGTFDHIGAATGGTFTSTDGACGGMCTADSACTVWARQPSSGLCWLSKQAGPITFTADPDRTSGTRCPAAMMPGKHRPAASATAPRTTATTITTPVCRDDDACLQAKPAWGNAYNCAGSTQWCVGTWAADMKCCPKACGTCAMTTQPPTTSSYTFCRHHFLDKSTPAHLLINNGTYKPLIGGSASCDAPGLETKAPGLVAGWTAQCYAKSPATRPSTVAQCSNAACAAGYQQGGTCSGYVKSDPHVGPCSLACGNPGSVSCERDRETTRETEAEAEAETETGGQTGRQTDRQTDRQSESVRVDGGGCAT